MVNEVQTNTKLEDLKSQTENVNTQVNVVKEKKQSNTKDPSSLTEEQILTLTAVILGEGGSDYSLREIAWVYVNNIRAMGFEKAMRTSSTYSVNGPGAKVAVRSKSFEMWKNTVGGEETFPDVAPGNSDQAQRLLKFIREEVLAKPETNPFPTFRNQGYWGDLNKGVNYTPEENGDYFNRARQYLRLWLKKEVDGKYMVIIGSGIKTSFLWDQSGIDKYFNDNPGKLPSDRTKIPQITHSIDYTVLELDGVEIKATRK